MQYSEEHYAQMYSNLPEGLKDLVLSGRLAILVSAIGSRHGLSPDQVADLEPTIEDVCLGILTKAELSQAILNNVKVDQRVANRISAEAELEIFKPFEAELIISRKQKEDLDAQISKDSRSHKSQTQYTPNTPTQPVHTDNTHQDNDTPRDVSEHPGTKKVSEWFNKNEPKDTTHGRSPEPNTSKVSFDWDTNFTKKVAPQPEPVTNNPEIVQSTSPSLEKKLDALTENINKLIEGRFGTEKKDDGISTQMQELMKRLEKAEKENEENKKLIRSLQSGDTSLQATKAATGIFGTNVAKTKTDNDVTQNKIQIDKERKVEIDHKEPAKKDTYTSNIQITSVSKPVPIQKQSPLTIAEPKTEAITPNNDIVFSSVSKDTVDSIVETRNKITPGSNTNTSTKKVLSLDELVSGDKKIKEATSMPTTGTLVFPGINDEKRVDIQNVSQKENLRQTLLDDLEFLKNSANNTEDKTGNTAEMHNTDTTNNQDTNAQMSTSTQPQTSAVSPILPSSAEPFKDEILPKTKEERMKALQDKIKSLNKGVSVGGKTNISTSGLDPYRL